MSWRGSGNVDALVTQLLELESSLTTLVLETVLKIQTLTETKMFLLLENPADKSRRYCGDNSLVKQFRKSNFGRSGAGESVQLGLDPKVNLLVEKRREGTKRKLNDEGGGGGGEHSSSKRGRGNQDMDDVVPFDDFETDVDVDVGENGAILAIKDEILSDDQEAGDAYNDSVMMIKDDHGEDEADDVEEVIEYEEEEEEDEDDDDDQEKGKDSRRGRLSRTAPTAQKIQTLKELKDPLSVFQKHSRENKLLNNVLFGYGKALAQKCPFNDADLHVKEVKLYLNMHIKKFLRNFPHFQRVKKSQCSRWMPGIIGPNLYMKQCVTNGFRSYAPHFFEWQRNTFRKPKSHSP